MTEDGDRPMTTDEVISSANEIVDQLRTRWRESGLPMEVLAHEMVGAGITDLTNERGVASALQLLRELVTEIESAAPRQAN